MNENTEIRCHICNIEIDCICKYEGGRPKDKTCAMNHVWNNYPQSQMYCREFGVSPIIHIHICSKSCDINLPTPILWAGCGPITRYD